jgi:hypothetical protein
MSQKALTVLDFALQFYPNEPQLVESDEALKEFAASIKISHLIEKAERAFFKRSYELAINHYQDALFFLAKENAGSREKEIIAARINSEIEKIRELSLRRRKKALRKNLLENVKMISQNCPRCHSDRVRRGYRPTPFWSKLIFRYNLLCNACKLGI